MRAVTGTGEPHQVVRTQFDVQAAPAAGDQDAVLAQGALIQDRGGRLALPQRGNSAQHIAGPALGRGRIRHGGLLAAERSRYGFQVKVSVDRDDPHREPAVDLHHERLEDLGGIHAQYLGGLHAVAGGRGVVGVRMQHERNAGCSECCCSRRSL